MPSETATTALTPAHIILIIVTAAVCLAGLILLWRWELSPTARRKPHYFRVRHIAAPWPYFVVACAFVLITAFFAYSLLAFCCKRLWPELLQLPGYAGMLFMAALDIGAIAAVLHARRFLHALENMPRIAILARIHPRPAPAITLPQAILAGIGTFCVARALFVPLAFAWDRLLELLRVASGEQDLIELFRNETSATRVAVMIVIVVVIAPIAEEMVFRGGLYGYLRTRVHRQFALVLPSLVFALLHGNIQVFPLLFLFGVILSIAYERTGRLIVPIIAHALLNASTIVLILLGLSG